MKIIITESKLHVLALDWLDKMYGDFKRGRYLDAEYKQMVLFVKDDAIIFEVNATSGEVFVDKSIWQYLENLFNFGITDCQRVLSQWLTNQDIDFQYEIGMCDFKYSSGFVVDDKPIQN